MNSTKAYAVTNAVVSTQPCGVMRVQGYSIGNADAWLQFHDAAALPANGAVPLKSYFLAGAAPYSWAFDPSELETTAGLVVAVSTTEGALTISAATADILADVEPRAFEPSGYSTAGDLTTGRNFLQVWAEAAGPKSLYQVDYTNGSGAAAWLMLFAKDNGNTNAGDTPIQQWKVASAGTLRLLFGTNGVAVMSQDATTVKLRQGCTLQESSTASTLTKGVGGASNFRAYYL